MIFKELSIKGVFSIDLNPISDSPGFFMRTYDSNFFELNNLNTNWVHENHSTSVNKGTIRGFHFQYPPYSEIKLVRIVKGSVLDIFLDIRKNSPTFGKWGSIKLSSDNKKCLYLPKGIAHGMCTLENNTTMVYKVDTAYEPKFEDQIKWNDADINVDWPDFNNITISEKDKEANSFADFKKSSGGILV